MIKILITGENSYIGSSFMQYMEKWVSDYSVNCIDMMDPSWSAKDFSNYDVIFHVAGIAHQKETSQNAALYYEVNRDLAVAVAKKAKNEGVGQFVFLSSMSVYGIDIGEINRDTPFLAKNHYGRSKMQAESEIMELHDDRFGVSVVRPPMVYGKNCKGNFQKIIKIVKSFPVFPLIQNERSAIFIDNLCEFIKVIIDRKGFGLFFPQNKVKMNTSLVAECLAKKLGKKIFLSKTFGKIVLLFLPYIGFLRKAFGNLFYSDELEELDYCYSVVDEKESYYLSV